MFLPWTWCPDMSQALHIGKSGHGSENMLHLFPIIGREPQCIVASMSCEDTNSKSKLYANSNFIIEVPIK